MTSSNNEMDVLRTLVVALGAGLAIWGAKHMLEGYDGDSISLISQGRNLVIAGEKLVAFGITIPYQLLELCDWEGPEKGAGSILYPYIVRCYQR